MTAKCSSCRWIMRPTNSQFHNANCPSARLCSHLSRVVLDEEISSGLSTLHTTPYRRRRCTEGHLREKSPLNRSILALNLPRSINISLVFQTPEPLHMLPFALLSRTEFTQLVLLEISIGDRYNKKQSGTPPVSGFYEQEN